MNLILSSIMRIIILQESIEEKIQNAPDSSYEIGIFIGSMLPFVLLVVIAYLIYNYNKNRNKEK